MSKNSPIEIDVTVVEHGGADPAKGGMVLVEDRDGCQGWVPYALLDEDSEITAESEVGEEGELVIPIWLADELDLA